MTELLLPVYADIVRASQILQYVIKPTPVMTSKQADLLANAQVFFKCENFQRVGAFKIRGAYYAMSQLSEEERHRGVVAFSSGNHAQAIALAGQLLGVETTIVMPSDAPQVKLAATRDYGAKIVLYDRTRENRETIAAQLIEKHNLTLIPPYDHKDIIAGQGTVAKELFEEVGTLDYLFVPIGGGGLIAGSALAAAYLSPQCQVIGVEPQFGNDAQQSLRAGHIVSISPPQTIADGAQTQFIGKLVLPIILKYVKDIATVTDKQLCVQMQFFAERMKIIVEPTGCLAAAAVLNKVVDIKGKRVGVIVSGGNIDLRQFCTYINGNYSPRHCNCE